MYTFLGGNGEINRLNMCQFYVIPSIKWDNVGKDCQRGVSGT